MKTNPRLDLPAPVTVSALHLKEVKMKRIIFAICCLLLGWNANALEVAGVKLPDTAQVGAQELVLNGAGIRTKFFSRYTFVRYIFRKK